VREDDDVAKGKDGVLGHERSGGCLHGGIVCSLYGEDTASINWLAVVMTFGAVARPIRSPANAGV
jgi:hypothetical protein